MKESKKINTRGEKKCICCCCCFHWKYFGIKRMKNSKRIHKKRETRTEHTAINCEFLRFASGKQGAKTHRQREKARKSDVMNGKAISLVEKQQRQQQHKTINSVQNVEIAHSVSNLLYTLGLKATPIITSIRLHTWSEVKHCTKNLNNNMNERNKEWQKKSFGSATATAKCCFEHKLNSGLRLTTNLYFNALWLENGIMVLFISEFDFHLTERAKKRERERNVIRD